MSQQGQGPSSGSNVPIKRKRGRPRKDTNVPRVPGENVPVMPAADNVVDPNQTAGTTDVGEDEMVGKAVSGVIEGRFNAGYLVNVKMADSDESLRGLVFLPGEVAPITTENDVAPNITMIKRKEIPISPVKPQAEIHGSVPSSSGQCVQQSFGPESQVPLSQKQVLPTEIHSLQNQPASSLIPISISSGGTQQETSEHGHVSQSASIMSALNQDKTAKHGKILHELGASTKLKESSADKGATKNSEQVSGPFNLVPLLTTGNTNKEFGTVQQAAPYMPQLNEVTHNEPNRSNIELNPIPLSAEHQAMPSEQTSKSVGNLVEKQDLPKTDVLEDAKSKLAIETLAKVDSSNPDEGPSTVVANLPDVGSNLAPETSQPESMPSEQIDHSVPSESKSLSYVGCDLQKSDPENFSSLGDIDKVDFNQPTESAANLMESEKQIEPESSANPIESEKQIGPDT